MALLDGSLLATEQRCLGRHRFVITLGAFLGLLVALPAAAADCPDADGDGYAVCGSCVLPGGKVCGDCNDGSSAIHPGAAELCGDATDNNCDGQGDDAVLFDLGKTCGVCDGPGCVFDFCLPGEDCPADNGQFCLTSSTVVCSADLLSSECPTPPSGLDRWEAEGGGTDAERLADPTCSDAADNDCDGFTDLGLPGVPLDGDPACRTTREFCDGLDNDDDGVADDAFPTLGAACSAGTGACQDSGVNVCSADKLSVVCDAVAASPKAEGPSGAASCNDGIDNDCDGLTDFPFDASCTAAETCDGLDNDGDGEVDETFPSLGSACSVGVGACRASGSLACSPDGSTTVCDALPALPAIEGFASPGSCSDTIDNDCDGLTDGDDPTCSSADLAVTCALPYFEPPKGKGRGKPGADCNSWHVIRFGHTGSDDAVVSAELLALDRNGNQIAAIPVEYGDVTHMASRLDPADFKLVTGTIKGGQVNHELFAPVPMLKVTAKDGYKTAHAYCSIVPFLSVVRPNGDVVSASEGDVTNVEVALPQVDPSTLEIKVDGVEILSALGIDPSSDLPGGPFGGVVMIDGAPVQIADLVVETPAFFDFAEPSSHTLTMSLTGLGCGGHVVKVSGEYLADALRSPISSACHVDDMADAGESAGFGIEIFSPTHLATGVPVPTRVTGLVCHGRPIEEVTVNGLSLDVLGNTTFVPAPTDDGCTAPTIEYEIDVELPETNLAADFATGDEPLATFDPGSNRVIASATDDLGNRTYDSDVVFATGEVATPGVGPLSSSSQALLDLQLQAAVQKLLESEVKPFLLQQIQSKMGGPTVEIENAFVVGLTPNAINDLFGSKCTEPGVDGKTIGEKFADAVDLAVRSKSFDPVDVNFPCSCDLTLRLQLTNVSIDPDDVSCPVYFPGQADGDGDLVGADVFRVFVNLPDVSVTLHDSDSCKTKVLGVCIAKSSASATITASITDIHLKFEVTEGQLQGLSGPPPSFVEGVTSTSANVSSDVGCIGGDICEGVLGLFNFDITPNIDVSNEVTFTSEIGAGEPDPIELGEIKVDEEVVAEVNQTLKGNLDTVDINGQGIVAGLTGQFATNSVDPEVEETPGASLTPAPVPTLPFGDDATVLLADDTINMMFASMTAGGALKTNCVPSAKTVGDLLPADCQTIAVMLATPAASEAATDAAQGVCEAVRGTDCETLVGSGFLTTPLEQGACHGLLGDSCSLIPAGFASAVFPADCESIVIDLPENPTLGQTATSLLQGVCHGEAGADCETLFGATDGQTAIEQGACHGSQGAACQTLPAPTVLTTPVERGTCEGVKGTDCATLASGAQVGVCNTAQQAIGIADTLLADLERGACESTPAINLDAAQPLLFCSRQDIPPNFKVVDDGATDPVETALRLTDLSMAIAVDRDGGGFGGELSSTASCFNGDAPSVGDCLLAGLCLDLNIDAAMQLVSPPSAECADKPGLLTQINGLVATIRQAGVVCGGLPAGDDGSVVDNSASANESLDVLEDNAEIFAPPICASGLTLGGFVNFLDPRLIAVETDGDASFQDYLGVTGTIDP